MHQPIHLLPACGFLMLTVLGLWQCWRLFGHLRLRHNLPQWPLFCLGTEGVAISLKFLSMADDLPGHPSLRTTVMDWVVLATMWAIILPSLPNTIREIKTHLKSRQP